MPGTTYIDYFEKASSGADEDTLVGQNLYKFFAIDEEGLALTDMPFNGQVDAGNVMGQSYPNIDPGNLPQNVINHQGLLVNGVPIFGMLGKATHTINNQKQTITNFTTSEPSAPILKCSNTLNFEAVVLWVGKVGVFNDQSGVCVFLPLDNIDAVTNPPVL